MDHSKQMGEGRISQLLIKFSVPAIVGMVVNALYNMVDRIFIGQGTGSKGIAAATIGFPVMIIMMAFGMLIGLGATTLISIRLGEKNKEEAEQIMGNGLTLLLVSSVILSGLGLLYLRPMLVFVGASEEILPLAEQYMRIILLGGVFQAIGFGMNNFIRAEGNPGTAMFTMLIGGILNVILDPLFIFTFKMGIAGAAIATILSMLVSSVWVLYYFIRGKSSLKLHWKNLKPDLQIAKTIVAVGSAPFFMQLAASGIMFVVNVTLVRYGGDTAISVMGIMNSLSMLIFMPVFGINQGAQPIIGYNFGAGKFYRVKRTLKIAVFASTVIVTAGFFLFELFPEPLISLFSKNDPELIRVGSRAMRIFMMMTPIVGFQIICSGYFQAVGKPVQAMFLSLSRQVIILLPALLILPRFFGLDGALYAAPVSDLLSSVLTGFMIWYELRHLDAALENQNSLFAELEEGCA